MAMYLDWTIAEQVVVTWGLFCLWIGSNDLDVDMRIKRETDPLAGALKSCKRMIHSIIETAAMNGSLNPLIYFHQNKGYFGMVEKQEVKVEIDTTQTDLSAEQTDEKIKSLPTNLL